MRWLREWWRGVRRRRYMRRNVMIGAAEVSVQKSGALQFRRDPCGPGGCVLMQQACEVCTRRLYECETARSMYPPPSVNARARGCVCASCLPFAEDGTPDGFLAADICSHGQPLWQQCQQCASESNAPVSLEVEKSL